MTMVKIAAAAVAVCSAVSGAAGAVAPAVGGLVRADLKARCDFPEGTFTPPFIPMLTGRKATGYEPHLWDAPKNGTFESGLYNATKLFLTGEKRQGEAEMQSILWRDPSCAHVSDVGVYSSVLCHLTPPAKAVVDNYLKACRKVDTARLLREILKPGGLTKILDRTSLPRGFNSLGRKMEQVRDYLAQNERTLPPLQTFEYVAKVLGYHLNIGAAPTSFYTSYIGPFSPEFKADFGTWVKYNNPALYDKIKGSI